MSSTGCAACGLLLPFRLLVPPLYAAAAAGQVVLRAMPQASKRLLVPAVACTPHPHSCPIRCLDKNRKGTHKNSEGTPKLKTQNTPSKLHEFERKSNRRSITTGTNISGHAALDVLAFNSPRFNRQSSRPTINGIFPTGMQPLALLNWM